MLKDKLSHTKTFKVYLSKNQLKLGSFQSCREKEALRSHTKQQTFNSLKGEGLRKFYWQKSGLLSVNVLSFRGVMWVYQADYITSGNWVIPNWLV